MDGIFNVFKQVLLMTCKYQSTGASTNMITIISTYS